MEKIWGFEKCASFSLSGGKSPKTPDALQKDPAPPECVKVLLGKHRVELLLYCHLECHSYMSCLQDITEPN